jgi:2-dehydropantoate 2-reductase
MGRGRRRLFRRPLVKGGADVHFVRAGRISPPCASAASRRRRAEPIHLPKVNVTDDPKTIGRSIMVMFCVKLWDTETPRASSADHAAETGVISFQNGVQKDDMLRPIFGDKALMGGVAYVGTSIGRPGVIAQTGRCNGWCSGSTITTVPRVSRHSTRSAGAATSTPKSATMSVARSGKNTYRSSRCPARLPACAKPSGRSAATRSREQFLFELAREVVAVGRAHGVALPEDYAEQRKAFFDSWPPEMTTSMHHDLQQGKPLELRWLSGGVVNLGAAVGVPTPMNRAVRDLLILHADGARS